MNRNALGKAAISSLLVATTMVGCTGAAFHDRAAVAQPAGEAGKFAADATRALDARNGAKAVPAAEAAVRLDPQNPAYRQLLGRAYILAGRFASADATLSDAVTLGNGDGSTIVSLALVKVAQGRAEDARALLIAHADHVPAGDYGLAMALAGDAVEGVRILSEAIHDPAASARTRQNLAYAYALAGRWKDARTVAGMDMAPLAANKRISDWAQTAEPSLAPLRVAALMGVTINPNDPGQPTALALAPQAPAPVQVAQADPAPVDSASAAPEAVAAPSEEPDATGVAMLAAAPSTLPAPVFAAHEVVQPLPHAVRRSTKPSAPAMLTARAPEQGVARFQKAAFVKPVGSGASNWVVQLGAYDTAAIAKEKWAVLAHRYGSIAAFPVQTSQATVEGRAYHRLAISGFASRTDAMTACRAIRARSGQCFVRETAPDATPRHWAAAFKGRQFAAR